MITEDYVSFDTAKLLKEKGFNEPCKFIYDAGYFCSIASRDCRWNEGYGELIEELSNSEFSGIDNRVSAPTLQMAMKWLRKVHNIFIDIAFRFSRNADNDINFSYYVEKYENYYGYGDGEFNSYEEACEAAIKYCLENLI